MSNFNISNCGRKCMVGVPVSCDILSNIGSSGGGIENLLVCSIPPLK